MKYFTNELIKLFIRLKVINLYLTDCQLNFWFEKNVTNFYTSKCVVKLIKLYKYIIKTISDRRLKNKKRYGRRICMLIYRTILKK